MILFSTYNIFARAVTTESIIPVVILPAYKEVNQKAVIYIPNIERNIEV